MSDCLGVFLAFDQTIIGDEQTVSPTNQKDLDGKLINFSQKRANRTVWVIKLRRNCPQTRPIQRLVQILQNEPQSSKMLERAQTKNETKQLLEIGNKTSQIDVILPNNSWGLISELLLTQKLYYNCYKLINHMEDISIS